MELDVAVRTILIYCTAYIHALWKLEAINIAGSMHTRT